MAMQFKQTLEKYKSGDFIKGPWFYVRSPDEMYEAACKYEAPEAFENTLKIASECDIQINLDEIRPPEYDMSSITDNEEYKEWLGKRHDEDHEW